MTWMPTVDGAEIPVHVTAPVLPGSIVVIDEGQIPPGLEGDDSDSFINGLLGEIKRAAGHDNFVLMICDTVTPAGGAKVFGPDDLVAAIRATAEGAAIDERGFCGKCGLAWEGKKGELAGAKRCDDCGFTWTGYYGPDDYQKVSGQRCEVQS